MKLERQFWAEIDKQAKKSGRTWQEWAITEMATKLEGASAASWLRVTCLLATKKGAIYGN